MTDNILFAAAALHGLSGGLLLGGFVASVRHRKKYKRTWAEMLADDKAVNVIIWLMLVYHITGEYVLSR